MAVTSTFTRQHSSFDSSTFNEYATAAFTGTYATGGFTWNPFTIYAGKGSSPLPSSQVVSVTFQSPLGYIYVTTISGTTATTKILSAANTEFGNGSAVPDATVPVIIVKRKI